MKILSMMKAMFTSVPRVAPAECAARVRGGKAILVDVREPAEWEGGVAQSARLLPLSDLTGPRVQWRPFLAETGDREILLYCAAGGRSGLAARLLAAEGFRAVNAGAIGEWLDSGWPIVQAPTASTPAR